MVAVLKLSMAFVSNIFLSMCAPKAPKITAKAPSSAAIFFIPQSYVQIGSKLCYIYDSNFMYSWIRNNHYFVTITI